MKRTTIRGVRTIREPHQMGELPYSLDDFDAAGNLDCDARALSRSRQRAGSLQRRLCLRHGARVITKHEPRSGAPA